MRAVTVFLILSGAVSAQPLPKVLRPRVAEGYSKLTAPDSRAVRSRLVWVDLRPFDVTGLVDPGDTRPERTVVFDLFDDVSLSVRFTSYELTADRQCVLFYGTVEGPAPGRAVVALSANLFAANLTTGGGKRY